MTTREIRENAPAPQDSNESEEVINGIDTRAVGELAATVREDPAKGMAAFRTVTSWKGGFQSETEIDGWSLGGTKIPHRFKVAIDEPRELCGLDQNPNPQEMLMAAANACMLNTFVAVCSLQGVRIESLSFESEGALDLRGFLGIDPDVPAGYERMRFTIRVKGDGTRALFEKAHEAMRATSPNFYNLNRSIAIDSEVVVE